MSWVIRAFHFWASIFLTLDRCVLWYWPHWRAVNSLSLSSLTGVRDTTPFRTFLIFIFELFLIFARENKPCPVTGMTLRHFAEVSTIDIAQLALKQGRQVLLSPITCRQAQHTYSHIESPRRCVCGFKYGNPTHFQPKFISLRSRITALPTSTTSQTGLLQRSVV